MNRKRFLFKTSAIRLLAMTLCVLMLWGMLPGITASAAETPEFEITYEMHARKNPALKQTRAIGTNEYGETTFTTFEDLKSLLSRDYSDTVILAYTGTESLEIKESITIPANVAIYSLAQIVIPSGITVWQNGELLADTLVVDGVLYNYGILDIVSALTINGQVTNCYLIYMYSGIDTVLTGSDNLGYGPQGGYVLWMCGFSSGDELIKSIHATTNPGYHYGHWQYVLYPEVSEINLKHNPDLAPVGDYCTLLID